MKRPSLKSSFPLLLFQVKGLGHIPPQLYKAFLDSFFVYSKLKWVWCSCGYLLPCVLHQYVNTNRWSHLQQEQTGCESGTAGWKSAPLPLSHHTCQMQEQYFASFWFILYLFICRYAFNFSRVNFLKWFVFKANDYYRKGWINKLTW